MNINKIFRYDNYVITDEYKWLRHKYNQLYFVFSIFGQKIVGHFLFSFMSLFLVFCIFFSPFIFVNESKYDVKLIL